MRPMKCLDCGHKFFAERGTEMTVHCPICGSGRLRITVVVTKEGRSGIVKQEQRTLFNL